MHGVPFRSRIVYFLSIATPALSAFIVGRVLGNCAELTRVGFGERSLPGLTAGLLGTVQWLESAGLPLARLGGFAAIAISVLGFFLAQRAAAHEGPRSLMLLAMIAWSAQITLLLTAFIAVVSALAPR